MSKPNDKFRFMQLYYTCVFFIDLFFAPDLFSIDLVVRFKILQMAGLTNSNDGTSLSIIPTEKLERLMHLKLLLRNKSPLVNQNKNLIPKLTSCNSCN